MTERKKAVKAKSIIRDAQVLFRQATLITMYAWFTGWKARRFFRWMIQPQNLTHAGAGATEIGCFGPNPHVVWEATSRCNLRCGHCHAFGGEKIIAELNTAEAMSLIKQVADAGIGTFVFSGGEPLLREDLFELIDYARQLRLNVFIASNGTLITGDIARELKEREVGVVIGIDALDARIHDRIRGVEGALEAAKQGILNSSRAKLYLHLNIVATRINLPEVARVIDYGNQLGAFSYFIYRFVPIGRGEDVRQWDLDDEQALQLMQTVLNKQRTSSAFIIPVAFPEYWAYAAKLRGIRDQKFVRSLGQYFGGCQAGRGMTYIKPDGDVWACPFLPTTVGNIKDKPLTEIRGLLAQYRDSLSIPKCTGCYLEPVCGGCKARPDDGVNCTV